MQDEIEIEVFRADTRASRGLTAAHIAEVAEFDCDTHPVGGVIGHPKSDSPAVATVKKLRAEGNKLFATVGDFKDKLIEGIRDKSILNRSMAFFDPDHEANPTPGKWAPRHLGFLGAAAPGIPGMGKLADAFSFSADDDLVIEGDPAEALIFEAAPTPVRRIQEEASSMTAEEIAAEAKRLADERAEFTAEQTAFAASRKTASENANRARVASLITAGRVLPADKDALEMVFNALGDDELTFSADDKGQAADKLAAIILKGPVLVDTTGKPISPSAPKEFAASGNASKDAKALTAAAKELMDKDKSLTFEAAIETVTAEQEA